MAHAPALLLESLRPLRRREYDRLVELGAFADERVELLSGVLVAMTPQGPEHADVVRVSSTATLQPSSFPDVAVEMSAVLRGDA